MTEDSPALELLSEQFSKATDSVPKHDDDTLILLPNNLVLAQGENVLKY